MTSHICLTFVVTLMALNVMGFKEKSTITSFIEHDLSSLEGFKKSIRDNHAHSFPKLIKGIAHNITGEEEEGEPETPIVFSINPISLIPITVFMDNHSKFTIANLDFNKQLTTFALPLLIRGVSNLYMPTAELNRSSNNILTSENYFECHSFFSDDYSCYIERKSKENSKLYVKAAQKFNLLNVKELISKKSTPVYFEPLSIMLAVGFEYSEIGISDSLLPMKDVVGIAPVKKNGKLANTFLETMFAKFATQNRNFKITSYPAVHVKILMLSNMPYDIIKPIFEVGVNEKIEDYEVTGELKRDSKDGSGKLYINIDRFNLSGKKREDIKKLRYDPTFPGFGLPKSMVDAMILSKEYKIEKLGGKYSLLYLDTNDNTYATVHVGDKMIQMQVADAVATWAKKSVTEYQAVILIESLPEDDTVVLGYLPIRRYSILVDVDKNMMGFKRDN